MRAAPVQDESPSGNAGPGLTDADRAVLARVEGTLADGVALLRWWRQRYAARAYARRFRLIREFNRSDQSFGFFDEAPLPGRTVPVMGMAETLLYDQVRGAGGAATRDELREFILHYFLRVSAFEQPEAYAEAPTYSPPPYLSTLSWCPAYEAHKSGFGYSQHYYKLVDSGTVGKFRQADRAAIVDLRQVGPRYEWVVLKVRIYDFNLTIRPRGQESLQFILPLREESYLVLSRDFILNEDDPGPDVLGSYGVGYAFLEDPVQAGPFGYGPGRFTAAFQLIYFHLLRDGRIELELVFVANRPERILNLTLAPLDWGFRVADFFTFGLTSRLLAPVRRAVNAWPLRITGFDLASAYVALANLLTGGRAAQDYCISREQLEKDFLVQHFTQHYQMATGSLLTWRQHASWLNRDRLPEWVVTGRTS